MATNPCYLYERCTNPINDGTENSILCDSCLIWYHYRSVYIKKQPKSKHQFCYSCYWWFNYVYTYARALSECISYRHLDVWSQKHVDNEIIYKSCHCYVGLYMQILLSLPIKSYIAHQSCTYCYYHRLYRLHTYIVAWFNWSWVCIATGKITELFLSVILKFFQLFLEVSMELC